MNIFEETIKLLKSKVQLRKLFQDTHAEDMQRVINRIEAIYEEKMLIQMEQEEANTKRQQAIDSVLNQMKGLELSVDDLNEAIGKTSQKPRTSKPRQRFLFRFEDTDGTSVEWEGATTGRIPACFVDYLERSNKTRKDCIIQELN
ncbi:hypothetical protein CI610_02472 [invertebrate metagenome]|uniref:DNA-binding protein H-NS-like N-terminal domain-containing protein n=1 Tax=invertebrate metagenome TaxID=1711999 RepID=A0A2H9T5U0_9ZZZZ